MGENAQMQGWAALKVATVGEDLTADLLVQEFAAAIQRLFPSRQADPAVDQALDGGKGAGVLFHLGANPLQMPGLCRY